MKSLFLSSFFPFQEEAKIDENEVPNTSTGQNNQLTSGWPSDQSRLEGGPNQINNFGHFQPMPPSDTTSIHHPPPQTHTPPQYRNSPIYDHRPQRGSQEVRVVIYLGHTLF